MKKIVLLFLTILLLITSITGCRKAISTSDTVSTTQSPTVVTTSPTTEINNTTILPTTEEPTTEKPTEPPTEATTESIETELFNGNNIKIIYTGFDTDSWISQKVKFRVDNNSDKDYTVQVRDVSVNGYMMDPICSISVLSGKKATDGMTFWNSDLKDNGIDKIEHIEFKFHIYCTYRDYFETDTITIDI